MDPTIFLAGAPHKRSGQGHPATAGPTPACDQYYPETHKFMTQNSVLLPGHPAPNYGANLQRSCDTISPYGKPPLICGRPFKEAVAAPSLLTGLGLDSSKRLLCSRQSQRGRGAPAPSMKLPPLETRNDASRSEGAVFNDTFFVTGGGIGGDQTELAAGRGTGNSNNAMHLTTATTTTASPSSLSNGRPRSTPVALPSDRRKLASLGNLESASGAAASVGPLSPLRRDAWTADAGCLGSRRLCFRSQPIQDLVSSTLLSIDPSGVFSMYEEWSSIKNRVLSRGLDEQRSDLALYEELRQLGQKEDDGDDSWISEDNARANSTTEHIFPERPSPPGETDSNGGGGSGCGGTSVRQDNRDAGDQGREQGGAPNSPVAETQECSEDRSVRSASLTGEAEEALSLGASGSGACGSSAGGVPPFGENESLLSGMDDISGVSDAAAPQGGSTGMGPGARSEFQPDTPSVAIDDDCATPARRRRRPRKEPPLSSRNERAVNLDYARNLDKEPGLPPLRLLRESSEGALRLAHMALGDPHVMALLASLDHLPSLTSIDVSDNRIGSTAIQKVVLTAEEKGVASLDLSSNHIDRASTDMLCAFLARPASLSSLIVKNAGVSDLAGAAMMTAIGKNTILKTLDLSGNDIGGTSDLLVTHHHERGASMPRGVGGVVGYEAGGVRAGITGRLTGGAAIATCLESNYWLTHLDLSWNKIGESNASTIGASIEYNQGLRWLSLAGNRVGDQGAFSLGTALAENCVLTHLDVSFNGISCNGAAALAHGLRENSAVKNIQVNGNLLRWAGGRALFRTVNFSEIPRIIGIRDCDEFAQGDLDAFDPRFPGGRFDLDLSNPGQRAIAHEVLLAASYRAGCSLTEVNYLEALESAAPTLRSIELVRPSPSAPALQPRGTATTTKGSDHLTLDHITFGARTWSDLRTSLEDLLVRAPGDSEPWRLPSKGRISGAVDFQPLPPCMANMCNASGLKGIIEAMSACGDTRVAAFRLFVADLFFTTTQIQWVIEQLAGRPNPLNSAELLEMMAAVAPQVYNNEGLPDLIETNLSPMGRRMLVAQLGEAYPAFIGGVSGPFVLDLRFSAHRLAAVRLAEAENFQQRERSRYSEQEQQDPLDEEEEREGGNANDVEGGANMDDRDEPDMSNLLGLWCGFRNVRYKPTRAATSTAAAVENDAPGGGVEGQEGDAEGGDGKAVDLTGEGEEGEKSAAAPTVGVAKTGLGEPMEAFFQRGLSDRPTGVLQLDFVCTVRPPEGTQPISDLALARMLNSCGMLDPNFWHEYLRPTSFPISFVDLIRLLRVRGRGDKRQAKLLVLLLRVKNSIIRAARAEKKLKDMLGTSMRRHRMGYAFTAFDKAATRNPKSIAPTVRKIDPSDPEAKASGSTTTVAAGPQVAASGGSNHNVSSGNAAAAPAEGSAVGFGGNLGASFSPSGDEHSSQTADGNSATLAAGAITGAAGAAALPPGAAHTGVVSTTTTPSARNRKPNALGSRGKVSTINRVVKSFPRHSNGRAEEYAAGAGAAAVPTSPTGLQQATEVAQQQALTPTQAAVAAADSKLEGLLSGGGILRAKSGWERPHGFPQSTPVWDSTEIMVGSVGAGSCGRVGGDRSGLGGGVCVSGGGCVVDGGLDGTAPEDMGNAVMEWASRFCENEAGFPAADSQEGLRLGRMLARHVVRDGDAGLIGTRPPTLLVHGLCIRVKHRETGGILRVKQSSVIDGMVQDKPVRHKKDEWAAVSRQGIRGSHLRIGTKKEVTAALAATFVSRVQQRDLASITPRTLGTLNMTDDEDWRETFVPMELLASNTLGGPLPLRLLVTFVEVSAQFLPDDCLRVSEFAACDHKQREAVYEWVPSDQGPEVVNTSSEPALCRSLAQLRSRLGSCWLSSAQAATVASLVPRVLGGNHHRVDAVVSLFSRVVDLHNFRQVVGILHEKKRPQLLHQLGDLDAFHPTTTPPAPATTLTSAPVFPENEEGPRHIA